MSDAHTPGEWHDDLKTGTWSYEVRSAGCLICVVGNLGATSDYAPAAKRWKAETKANARLIAAAPDLLEALRLARDHFVNSKSACAEICDAAILKATTPNAGERG